MADIRGFQRLLVFRIGQIGDTIIALPVLWELKSHFPSARLCFLTKRDSNRSHAHPRDVLPERSLIDEWFDYPSGDGSLYLSAMFSLLLKLRRQSFDALVYLAPRRRSRLQIWRDLTFFRLAGITRFIAHQGFEPLPPVGPDGRLPPTQHEADHLLHRLALSGLPVPPTGKGRMDLCLSDEEQERALSWLKRRTHIRDGEPFRFVAIGPSSKWPSKVWPEESFAHLGALLIQDLDVFPIVMGGPEDRDLGERLVKHWRYGVVAAGELTVREAAAVLKYCQAYIGNDTGTMHLAAAVGTKCVAICSAQDWPGSWYPYGQGHKVIRHQVPCEGCLLRVCVTNGLRCLTSIAVEEVLVACRDVISSRP